MATQKDVARRAGVSAATVSRVLNKSTLVEPETRERVEQAIRELSYKPNLVAAGLRARSSKLIGLVLPETTHSFMATFAQEVGDYCMEKGYSVIVGSHHNDCIRERELIDEYHRRNIDGLIVVQAMDGRHQPNDYAREIRIPTVMFERESENPIYGNVVLDNRATGEMVARYLLELGHRRMACTIGPHWLRYLRQRLEGFRQTLEQAGASLPPEMVMECDFNYQKANFLSGEEAAAQFFDGRDRADWPTAVWAHNDSTAAGVLRALSRRGIRVPEDVSVMGLDNVEVSQLTDPSLTTVSQNVRTMARSSVDLILQAVSQGRTEIGKTVINAPVLIQRESTGPCREQPKP